MENEKLFMITKKKAIEIIESERCSKCGATDLEYAIVEEDERGKYLMRSCKSCGNVLRFMLNK